MVPKVLLLDIETAPNVAYVWRLYDDFISPDHLVSHSSILCVAAKWLGDKELKFYSVWKDGRDGMLKAVHAMLDDAEIVVHYNGKKFDIPTLNREFLTTGLTPPSPYKHIDLLNVVRAQFKFTSNKLDYVCQRLGLGTKIQHKGMKLWHDCINGDKRAFKVMETYNKQDVKLLEKLYYKVLPWVPRHPNVTLSSGARPDACPRCGGKKFKSKGQFAQTAGVYKKYVCHGCGGYFRGERVAEVKAIHQPI